jgi:hypothetical protein
MELYRRDETRDRPDVLIGQQAPQHGGQGRTDLVKVAQTESRHIDQPIAIVVGRRSVTCC